MFVRHAVADYEAWKAGYDDFDTARSSMGITGQAVFQSVDKPTDVTVWHDFESADAARKFVSSPELRRVMQSAGVRGEPEIWFTEPS